MKCQILVCYCTHSTIPMVNRLRTFLYRGEQVSRHVFRGVGENKKNNVPGERSFLII